MIKKKIHDYSLGVTSEGCNTIVLNNTWKSSSFILSEVMCQEKEVEDLPPLRIP